VNYTLAVLTHGNGDTLRQTLESFAIHVGPEPHATIIYRDGPGPAPNVPAVYNGVYVTAASKQGGFCNATMALWLTRRG
jgi:hypothetical protein